MTLEITKSQRQHQLIQSDNIGYSFQINSFRYRVKLLLQLFICLSVFTLLAAISWPSAATDIAPNPQESDLSSPPPKATTSASNPVTLNQVEAGQLLFDTEIQGQFRQALNMHNEVNFQINGMVATVHLRQSFKNNSLDWLNGVYVFPLPDAAAVYKMQLEIGDRIIQGEIKEKQQAKKIYQEAKKAGKKVSLVSQQRPNLFSNKIANIGPGETVTVAGLVRFSLHFALQYITKLLFRIHLTLLSQSPLPP